MKKTTVVLTAVLAILLSGSESSAGNLAKLIPGLYGGDGIFLATNPLVNHTAHFTIDSTASINQLNERIATEIGLFPFSSSVGGFTFAFDPSLGTFVRTTATLGPLFAERAPTLGRGKLNLNFSFTFFKYDNFGGERLDDFLVVARHEPDVIGLPDVREQFELDTIQITLDLDIRIQIFSLAATYGVTDRLDVGILIPIATVDMDVKSTAVVIESPGNTLFPGVHTFVGGPESPDDGASDHAAGLGDIVLRAKYLLLNSDVVDIAGSVLTKFETGNERDFLGTGDTTVRPFLVVSRTFPDLFASPISVTPHVNIGFEFNLGRSEQSSVEYAAGFDLGTKRLTVAADVLGSHEPNGDDIGDDIVTGSLGVKWNPLGRLLLSANVQVPFNDAGLRSNVITTFGVQYSL